MLYILNGCYLLPAHQKGCTQFINISQLVAECPLRQCLHTTYITYPRWRSANSGPFKGVAWTSILSSCYNNFKYQIITPEIESKLQDCKCACEHKGSNNPAYCSSATHIRKINNKGYSSRVNAYRIRVYNVRIAWMSMTN